MISFIKDFILFFLWMCFVSLLAFICMWSLEQVVKYFIGG